MPIGGLPNYPTIASVTSPLRSLVGDDMRGATGTLGEGQIFVDNTALSVTLSNFFNLALQSLCQDLRTNSGPMLIYDNVLLLGVPALVSPTQGSASPDPGVQVSIGFNGYFDGTQLHSQWVLPENCIMVERLWERLNQSNDDFRPMSQMSQGLTSQYQDVYNRIWEWRTDQIWMPGSISVMDFRMRYQGGISPIYGANINTATTYIPILDCGNAMTGKMLQMMAIRQGPLIPQQSMMWANDEVTKFLNEWVKRDQGMPYEVIPFNGGGHDGHTGLI